MHEIRGNKDYGRRGREGRKRTRKEEIQAHQIHAFLQVYAAICPYESPF
jgi:hypothetical protein